MRKIPALFLPLLLAACGHEPPPPVTGPHPAPYVVETMAPGETGMELRFSGRIEGINATVVTARTAGTVSALPHEIGDRVPAGAVVVRLRSTEQRSSAAQAEAAVRAANAQATETALRRSRIADMQARQVVAKATLDTAVAADEAAQGQLAAAQAAREAAREGMAYTAAAAPYAAIITDRYELLVFGAKIARRDGSPLVEQTSVTEPIEDGEADIVHPSRLGGTRHLSAAQFVHDQHDAMAMVASQDGRFTIFAWSPCEGMVHAHRVETLLL